ncbi:MAG TPA: tetratricopeptide repeat protein [Tepidisphaeraceae bacterium]|jgi:tetratricopeptide (TPR) repeat protein
MVVIALPGCLVPQVAMSPRERGDSMASHGFWDAAIYHYTRAIEADPNDVNAYAGRGRAYAQGISVFEWPSDKPKANLPAALADYDRALSMAPEVAQWHANRACARAAAGQLDGALADVDEAMKLDPSDGLFHGYRGLVLLRMFRDSEAEAEFARCVERVPFSRFELNRDIERVKSKRGSKAH